MFTFKDFAVERQETQLKDGTRLINFYRKGMPIFIRTYISAGGKYAPDGKEGLPHFYEHMMVAGTKKFTTKDKLAHYIENVGGVFGAFTSTENLGIDVEIASENDISVATEILSEILQYTTFDKNVLETERGSILKEIGDSQSNPARYIWSVADKLFFQNTSNSKNILGSAESVKSITKNDLVKFKNDYINSDNLVIVASGGIKIDKLKSALDKKINLKSGKNFKPKKPALKARDNHIKIKKYKDSNQIHLVFGFRTFPSLEHERVETIHLGLAKFILGDGRASLLTKKLRYEKGLVYSVWAINNVLVDGGSWEVKTSTEKDNLNEVLDIIYKELKNVKENGFTQEQLDFIKNKQIKSTRRTTQKSSDWARFHVYDELFYPKKALDLPSYLNTLENIKLNDLNKTVNKYFDLDNWYLAICGDVEESEIDFIDD